jgi:predicted DNA-binding helix-hairpin-helix protein
MDTGEKLDLLAEGARYDVCLASCVGNRVGGTGRLRDPGRPDRWIYPAAAPSSGGCSIVKVLQTNACARRCRYCVFAATRDRVRRVSLAPVDLAAAFLRIVGSGLAHGIFLSSGVPGSPDAAMARMIETAQILRERHGFRGYIHLKVLPGSSRGAIQAAARYATRLSVNLEAPDPARVTSIAPDKDFVQDLLLRMKWTGEAVQSGRGATSHTTQFVVGAAGESDLDILKTADWVYRELYLFRAYFSAYQPVEGALPRPVWAGGGRGELLRREHRLYQADYLLRGYGFRLPELVFTAAGGLPLDVDPKTAYALAHPWRYPVDINTASEEDLLRVPGIGPMAAARILRGRREQTLRGMDDLRRVARVGGPAAGYLRFEGRSTSEHHQAWRQAELLPATERNWQTGVQPLGKPDARYIYPGQIGRPLVRTQPGADVVVRCR